MSNVKCHEMSKVMKCQLSWNAKCHIMSHVIKSQMSWNIKCLEMSRGMKCWCWCWIYDPRSYTLRSAPSSPGRSFFDFSPLCFSSWRLLEPRILRRICKQLEIIATTRAFIGSWWKVIPNPWTVCLLWTCCLYVHQKTWHYSLGYVYHQGPLKQTKLHLWWNEKIQDWKKRA